MAVSMNNSQFLPTANKVVFSHHVSFCSQSAHPYDDMVDTHPIGMLLVIVLENVLSNAE